MTAAYDLSLSENIMAASAGLRGDPFAELEASMAAFSEQLAMDGEEKEKANKRKQGEQSSSQQEGSKNGAPLDVKEANAGVLAPAAPMVFYAFSINPILGGAVLVAVAAVIIYDQSQKTTTTTVDHSPAMSRGEKYKGHGGSAGQPGSTHKNGGNNMKNGQMAAAVAALLKAAKITKFNEEQFNKFLEIAHNIVSESGVICPDKKALEQVLKDGNFILLIGGKR